MSRLFVESMRIYLTVLYYCIYGRRRFCVCALARKWHSSTGGSAGTWNNVLL